MIVPWVRYSCGCSEGIWVDTDSKCRVHDFPVSDVYPQSSLGNIPDSQWIPINLYLEQSKETV